MMHRFTLLHGTRWLSLWMNFKAGIRKKSNDNKKIQKDSNTKINIFNPIENHNLRAKGAKKLLAQLRYSLNLVKDNGNDAMLIQNADQEILQMEGMLSKLQAINEVISSNEAVAESNIDDILNKILNSLQEQIISRNIFMRIYAENDIRISSKPRLMYLVLENLIENAIKHSNLTNNQSYVEVSIHKEAGKLRFTIEDNGIGIRKQSFDKIFNLFYKDNSKAEGGGLGLYIVREALQKLNGTISLESEEGCFTKIEIQIPFSVQHKSLQKIEKQSISNQETQSV
ncbi:ATP-binding protein [Catalinimonas sp. 4WD22]|uniref:sensor histidine kinase n=1 Tax=Catalinimonas locisalis TaxID=3133978 RepID=UPI0031013815